MLKEHRQTLEKFILNVQAYRETTNKAKAATKAGNHSKARDLYNDAQTLGEAVDKMISEVNEIVKGAEQLQLL